MIRAFLNKVKGYRKSEDGAVTVDWVVLTAAVVALAAGVGLVIGNSSSGGIITSLKNTITTAITATPKAN